MCAHLAVILWRSFSQCINKCLSIRLRLVNKQQQMKLLVATEDLLSRLLGELDDNR